MNKLKFGYEQRLGKKYSVLLLIESGYLADKRRDSNKYLFYTNTKGIGVRGEITFYLRDPDKAVQAFLAPYLRFVDCDEIQEHRDHGILIDTETSHVDYFGAGLAGSVRLNFLEHVFYFESLIGLVTDILPIIKRGWLSYPG